jgi:hypothetical protein
MNISCHDCAFFCIERNKNPHSLACGVFYCALHLPMYTLSCEKYHKRKE